MVMLATAVELATALKQDVDTVSAEQALAISSAQVETLTGMAFTPRTATLTLPSYAGQYVPIPLKPVRAVSALTIGGVAKSDYALTVSGLYRMAGWQIYSLSPQDIVMTVEYGTETTPDDIKGVVLEMAGFAYDGRSGVSAESVDDYRVSYTGILSSASQATLTAYGAGAGTVSMIGR